MARDPETLAHQEWLGYVQPVGLVVSIPALLNAQAHINRNIIPDHQQFMSCLPKDKEDNQIPEIHDFADFCHIVFDWRKTDLEKFNGDDEQFAPLKVTLPEYHETLHPTHVLREPEPKDQKHPWMMLIQVLPVGHDLDAVATADYRNWQATPHAKFERLLRETHVPLGLLCNGRQIRMVYAPRGETSGFMTFGIAEMAQVPGRPIFAALHMLLCEPRIFALGEKQRLPAILADSRKYQNVVSTKLAEQVLASLYELVRGFQAANERARGELLKDVLGENPTHVYNGLLTVLMRLVFVLFAEDRGLISNDSVYANFYSLTGLFERLRADAGRYPDTMNLRYGAWGQLLTLFRLIYEGGSHGGLKIPPRHGYLFDPDRYNFLEGRAWKTSRDRAEGAVQIPHISDGVVFRILNNLLILDGERLSYRTLDVEQIGSVYEVTMGFGLGVAKGATIAIRPKVRLGAPIPVDLEELLRLSGADRAKWLKANTDQEISGEAATALKAASSIPDLLAALERRIAHSATPSPIPKGGMVPIPSDERRRSGSNYTPRSLTQPIVETTLRPILQGLGNKPKPNQILDLKVCDPAMGSGAFHVEVCRQLADELVKAWHNHKQIPVLPPDEDEVLHARRLVAQRCLYGVDRNSMAVDLAKLSLWLATLAKDHPFTFLDHNFRCGDSLVGLTRDQIARFHWLPLTERRLDVSRIESRVSEAASHRQKILSAGDSMPDKQKQQELALADEQLDGVRWYGDLVVAAFFAADNEKKRKEKREEVLRELTTYLAPGPLRLERRPKAAEALREGKEAIRPYHWEIEFPEVFDRKNGGFDVIVGNPPFLGGARISSMAGESYFQWLTTSFPPAGHQCDLVGYFFRRIFALIRTHGTFGLIATNTIAQGDTREGGLSEILRMGGVIYAATRRYRWPGAAAVVVSRVCIAKGFNPIPVVLDDVSTDRISAYLMKGTVDGSPLPLSNVPYFSKGSQVYGQGFLFDDDDPKATPVAVMHQILTEHPPSRDRIFPYFGGDELNSSALPRPTRYAIYFSDLDDESALSGWPALAAIVRQKVRPEREALGNNSNNAPLKRRWWAYQAHRPQLYAIARARPKMLACSQVTAHLAFAFLPPTWIYSQKLCVFDVVSYAGFCVLQSRIHEVWAKFLCSTMKDDLNYSSSDCFETYPFPKNFDTDRRLEIAGQTYYDFRAALMVKNSEGLTKTYNRFHDPNERSADILRLRELHAAMDRAVLDAYGWTDIPTDCQFLLDYEEEEDDTDTQVSGRGRKKPWRYRWPDDVRDEMLARLLELNRKRAEEERLAGMQDSKGKSIRAVAKKAAAMAFSESPLFAYPMTEADRLICAASIGVLEQKRRVSSMDHLSILLLASHPDWCKEFLDPRDRRLLDKAVTKTPAAFFVGENGTICWKESRDYLELRKAIRVDHSAGEQPLEIGTEGPVVKASLPTGIDEVVSIAIKAAKVASQIAEHAAGGTPEQKRFISIFRQQARQMGLVAA